jgi:hypothetical protein
VASLLPGWLRSVASVVVYFVPPTFSVMMVDGSLSGRICPRVGVSEPAGGARPRLSGVDIGLAIPRRADPRCLFFLRAASGWRLRDFAPVMELLSSI